MWPASLRLELAYRDERTVLARSRHAGPLRVQRPFYPEDACHLYIVHPPGGVVGGDTLDVQVDARPSTRTLVTTPAATKFYRSDQRWARQRQHCQVAGSAVLEWLPQETILFAGSWARLETCVELAQNACFLGWDILCLGRPASGETFEAGACVQRIEIRREGRLLWQERCLYEGGAESLHADWGLAGYPVIGTFVCAPGQSIGQNIGQSPGHGIDPALMARARERLAQWPDSDRHGITSFGEVLVCRYLGFHTASVHAAFRDLWSVVRPALVGRAPVLPRIWST